MRPRNAVIGLCVLAALVISAVAAQSASAVLLFTCENTGQGPGFGTGTCERAHPTANGPWQHVLVLEPTSRRWIGTGATLIKGTHAGVKLGLSAAAVSGSGTVEASKFGEENYVHGTATLKLEEVTVTEPAGKGCKVVGGSITTKELESTTLGLTGLEKLSPVSGTVIAEFTVEGCSIASLNTSYKMEGSFKGVPTDTSLVLTETEITTQGTLTLGGLAAGLAGVLDREGRKIGSGEEWKKLAYTP
jgi:hypothetical protein